MEGGIWGTMGNDRGCSIEHSKGGAGEEGSSAGNDGLESKNLTWSEDLLEL